MKRKLVSVAGGPGGGGPSGEGGGGGGLGLGRGLPSTRDTRRRASSTGKYVINTSHVVRFTLLVHILNKGSIDFHMRKEPFLGSGFDTTNQELNF
jgi:hypothetical protein